MSTSMKDLDVLDDDDDNEEELEGEEESEKASKSSKGKESAEKDSEGKELAEDEDDDESELDEDEEAQAPPQLDLVQLLHQDNAKVADLFYQFEQSEDDDEKQDLFDQIKLSLQVHKELVEEIYYPLLPESVEEDEKEEAESMVFEAEAANYVAGMILEVLSTMEPSDDYFDGKMAVLHELCKSQVKREEKEIFDKLKAAEVDFTELGREAAERQLELQEDLSAPKGRKKAASARGNKAASARGKKAATARGKKAPASGRGAKAKAGSKSGAKAKSSGRAASGKKAAASKTSKKSTKAKSSAKTASRSKATTKRGAQKAKPKASASRSQSSKAKTTKRGAESKAKSGAKSSSKTAKKSTAKKSSKRSR